MSGILLSDISDHNTVFIHLPIATDSDQKIKLTFRCHDDLSMELFRTKLINVNWHNVLVGNVNEQVNNFNSTVNDLYCKSFSLKIKYISIKRLKSPWITSDVQLSINNKSKTFQIFKAWCHFT